MFGFVGCGLAPGRSVLGMTMKVRRIASASGLKLASWLFGASSMVWASRSRMRLVFTGPPGRWSLCDIPCWECHCSGQWGTSVLPPFGAVAECPVFDEHPAAGSVIDGGVVVVLAAGVGHVVGGFQAGLVGCCERLGVGQ